MNDNIHTYIEPELEARITALVLGEASEFEVDELERLIEEKPELAVFRRRVQMMHNLMSDAIKPQQEKKWQLSDDRRSALRQAFANKSQATEQSITSKPMGHRASAGGKQIRASVVIAACVMLCFILFMMATPMYKRGQAESFSVDVVSYMADENFEGKDHHITGGSSFQLEVDRAEQSRSKAPAKKLEVHNGRVPTIGDIPATGKLFKGKGEQRELARSERKPSSPTSGMSRVIASNKGTAIPVPEVDVPNPSIDFGNGDDFGDGWGGATASRGRASGGGSGEGRGEPDPFGATEKDTTIAQNGKSDGLLTDEMRGGFKTDFSSDLDGLTDEAAFRVDAHSADFNPLVERSVRVAGSSTFLGGGTVGKGNPRTGADFISPVEFTEIPGKSTGNAFNTATAGLRSGDFATTRNSIDAILNNPNRTFEGGESVAPGILSLTGLYSDGQVQSVNRKYRFSAIPSGITGYVGDFESRNTGVTLSFDDDSSRLGIEAIREFRYPTEYELPEVPNQVGGGLSGGNIFPVTPASPILSAQDDGVIMPKTLPPGPLGTTAFLAQGDLEGEASLLEIPAPSGGVSSIAQKEIARRSALVVEADKALILGREAYAKKDYEEATKQYQIAQNFLLSGPALADRRHSYNGHLGDAAVALAQKYRRVGKYTEARDLLESTLSKDPANHAAKKQLEYLDDPIRSGQALSYEHRKNVDKVRKHLYTGEGYYNLGKYDEAEAELRKTLKVDPYNKAARRWLEKVAATKSDYYRASYDHTRAELLKEVDKAWEMSVPPRIAELEQNREIERRVRPRKRPEIAEADRALINGRSSYSKKDYRQAAEHYRRALDVLPQEDAFKGRRASYQGHLADAKVALSILSKHQGDNGKAKILLGEALKLDPNNVAAKKQLKKLSDELKSATPLSSPVTPKALPDETKTSAKPFSTFSLNVSDVSFKLAKAALLEKGQWPDAAKVRTEEFVNAFDYGDPSPRRGEPVTCAIDQSAHPFLQQRNLLRVGMKTASIGRSAPLRLTILLDNSGSMEREDREASVLAAIRVLASQLGPQDVITVVGFARQPRLLADRISGDKAHQLVELVANTPSEGGTNIEEALRLARTLAKRQHTDGAQDRVVLITDGVANLGNTIPEELSKQIIAMRQEGIAFDACGVGADGLNDDILEALTRKGDGRYYFLNRAEDADSGFAKQLAGALTPAAKNVKVQVKFNPDRVSRYRLLGFEKHRLKKEDFRNDKVDAAEMAAEEAGNAVYQIQVNPQGSGELGEVFVRFFDVSTGRMVERSWPLPYEPQAPAFDVAAPAMQLAGTAAMLGEKLHGTDAGTVRFPMISDTLNKLRGHFAADPKVQDLIRMCRKVK